MDCVYLDSIMDIIFLPHCLEKHPMAGSVSGAFRRSHRCISCSWPCPPCQGCPEDLGDLAATQWGEGHVEKNGENVIFHWKMMGKYGKMMGIVRWFPGFLENTMEMGKHHVFPGWFDDVSPWMLQVSVAFPLTGQALQCWIRRARSPPGPPGWIECCWRSQRDLTIKNGALNY